MRFLVGVLGLIICLALIWERGHAQPAKKDITLIEGISSPDFGYVPSFIARAKGFLANEGVDLKIVVMRATVSVPALVSGEVQFAVHGSAMTAAMRGAPLKAIFFTYNTSIMQFTVRPEIKKPEDLRGKIIAISSPGGSQDQATRLMLKKFGLDPDRDVKLLAIGDSKARVIGMETGQITGSANNIDIAAELVRKGYKIIANSSEVYPVPFSGMIEERTKRGVPIATLDPRLLKEGAPVTPASGALCLVNRAPHPNAAKLYINWLLSKEAQTVLAQTTGYISNRVDVPTDHAPAWKIPQPDSIKIYDAAAKEMNQKLVPLLHELFGR